MKYTSLHYTIETCVSRHCVARMTARVSVYYDNDLDTQDSACKEATESRVGSTRERKRGRGEGS